MPSFGELQLPILIIELVGLGLGVGFLTGLFGIGGAFIATPMLISVLGIEPSVAVGSSLGYTIGSSAIGFAKHWRLGNVEVRTAWIIGLSAAAGSVAGFFVHRQWSNLAGPHFDRLISWAFVFLLVLIAAIIGWNKDTVQEKRSFLSRWRIPPLIDLPRAQLVSISLTGLIGCGLIMGLLKGMFGLGGGVILVPMLILAVGLTPHLAVGTSLGAIFLSSVVGCGLYLLDGHVNWIVIGFLMVGSSIGTVLGARMCQHLGGRQLRRWFAMVVVMAAVFLVVQLLVSPTVQDSRLKSIGIATPLLAHLFQR